MHQGCTGPPPPHSSPAAENVRFCNFAKFIILCFANFSSKFTKIKIILSKFRVSLNFDKIIFNFAKFKENLGKHEIKNFAKISRNYENKNFAATLLPHNLPSATHPPLPSARRFFNAAWKCYFEMKANKEPCFSILSFTILWFKTYNSDLTGHLNTPHKSHFILGYLAFQYFFCHNHRLLSIAIVIH